MLSLLLLAAVFALAAAQGLAEWQKPLPKPPGAANCGRGRKGVHMGTTFTFHVSALQLNLWHVIGVDRVVDERGLALLFL